MKSPPAPSPQPAPRRVALVAPVAALAALAALVVGAPLARADERPRMDPDEPVSCFVDAAGTPWRLQCVDEGGKPDRCLLAIDGEIDERGVRVRALERARACQLVAGVDQVTAQARGYRIVPAVADAPRGWMRDERGRVFQVTFDLHRRLYAGVSWAPALRRAGGDAALGRVALDVGLLEVDAMTGDRRAGYRHRLKLIEGVVQLAPFGSDLTVLRYDVSRRRSDPLFRITTFVGRPRRIDIDAHLGGWVELGHVRIADVAPGRSETLARLATAHLTWDLWRTAQMDSFVRLRGGVGAETAREDARPDRKAVTWAGAAEGDLTLGASGFNRLSFLVGLERPTFVDRAPGQERHARRALGRIGYERIVLAVNDQPVTLRVAGEAEYRDDVPDLEAGWDVRAIAGLRVNLWAPPR